MRESYDSASKREERSSALWGTGGRGGESRSSALWGKGGRGSILTAVAALALAAPLAATANSTSSAAKDTSKTYVAPGLSDKAKKAPNEKINVIIQSTGGAADAVTKVKMLGSLAKAGKTLNLVNGVSAQLPAKFVDVLAKLPGLQITPDPVAKTTGSITSANKLSSNQIWPHDNGDANLWTLANMGYKLPTIAIVDSGIDKSRTDFGGGARVLADVNLSTLDGNSPGDGRGHGTFVAGIAAGSAGGYAGATPMANLVSLDVMDDQGMARTSDVIAAADWILQHKDEYNIRVANFSLHSTYPSNFGHDPLDQAVERLWFAGVTVVAAAGNYGNDDGTASGVKYAPGNDPFVVTVGAVDLNGTTQTNDDKVPSWSAYGYTYDGFAKPEIGAAGRYMVGPVSSTATLAKERPSKIVAPGYMELSGTSFAAPIVSGTAAALLAVYPNWTPDQVKGALMAGATPLPKVLNRAAGVGQVNAMKSVYVTNPPNPNKALDRFITTNTVTGAPVFDAVSWYDTALTDVSWDSVSWSDVSWSSVSWSDVSWADVSWADVSWADVSWSDVSWADVSWADSAREDAVLSEPDSGTAGMQLDPLGAADLAADPTLTSSSTFVDSGVLDLLTTPTTTTAAAPTTATTSTTTTLP